MRDSAASIHCADPNCQAPNAREQRFCQRCRTPLVEIYLRAIGEGLKSFKIGQKIAERYLIQGRGYVIDTQPALPPQFPSEIPPEIVPYLKLFPYRLHVPGVYGYVPHAKGEIWLLEYGHLAGNLEARLQHGELLPAIEQVWPKATSLRQLNWLWQMARLWEPLSAHGAVGTLLQPSLLRSNDGVLQLQELMLGDRPRQPEIGALGSIWSRWIEGSSPEIREFMAAMCAALGQGRLKRSEQLVALLDRALQIHGTGWERHYRIFARSDRGPSRPQNEDACYWGGRLVDPGSLVDAVAIVCDGVGGHDSGEVASKLAISKVKEGLGNFPRIEDPAAAIEILECSIRQANAAIGERNDREGRQARRRMGTTLAMALMQQHQAYITHVGDSRVYWITASACHLITLDDNVAMREVRLGHALPREALQQPAAGSLIQALGVGSSEILRPSMERLVLDEDCIFLLCSDGLSDRHRVEQYWETDILPVLSQKVDLSQIGEGLIEIANTRNGHDNVTVALIYCRVSPTSASSLAPLSPQLVSEISDRTPSLTQPSPRLRSLSVPRTVPLTAPGVNDITELTPPSGKLKSESAAMDETPTQDVSPTPSHEVSEGENRSALLFLPILILVLLGGVFAAWRAGVLDSMLPLLQPPQTEDEPPSSSPSDKKPSSEPESNSD